MKKVYPLLAAFAVFAAVMALLIHASLMRTEGHLTYALDDAYIHMAIAKHLAQNGVWGVTPYEFSSASSSLLWTVLLAGMFKLFGIHESIPFVLNMAFACLVLVWVYVHVRHRLSPLGTFLTLLAVTLIAPLPIIVFCGMEHTLQILVVLAFATAFARWIADEPAPSAAPPVSLVVLAALLPVVRYEDLFVVFVACVWLLWRRSVRQAVTLGLAALIPIGEYGAWSVSQGSLALPNTVLLKSLTTSTADKLLAIPIHFARAKPLAALLVLALLLLWAHRTRRIALPRRDEALLALFVPSLLIHMQFAQATWYFRYESYLTVLGIVAVAPLLIQQLALPTVADGARGTSPLRDVRWVACMLTIVFVLVLTPRRLAVVASIPLATQNIYQQQYQAGRFLAGAYNGQVVAVNDLGAVNFLADLHCIDLMGLGDIEVARFRLANHRLSRQEAARLTRDRKARIVVTYDSWYSDPDGVTTDGLPPEWGEPVARWTIPSCVVCGDPTVSIYGMTDADRDTLAVRLRAFESQLPAAVVRTGRYLASDRP